MTPEQEQTLAYAVDELSERLIEDLQLERVAEEEDEFEDCAHHRIIQGMCPECGMTQWDVTPGW